MTQADTRCLKMTQDDNTLTKDGPRRPRFLGKPARFARHATTISRHATTIFKTCDLDFQDMRPRFQACAHDFRLGSPLCSPLFSLVFQGGRPWPPLKFKGGREPYAKFQKNAKGPVGPPPPCAPLCSPLFFKGAALGRP